MTREDFIFTRRFPQRLYRHILFWLVYYFFSLLTYFHDLLNRTTFAKWAMLEAAEVFFHVITQMLFCYLVLYALIPLWNKKRYFLLLVSTVIVTAATFGVYYWINIAVFKQIHTWASLPFRPPKVMFWFTVIAMFSYFPISAGLVVAIHILKRFYARQQENQLLTRENANAELQLLKAQVHPHFLFNTLNNIYSFTLSKSPEAPSLINKLSDTINYMVTDCNANAVGLEKELKMLEDYIGLEKVRYGDRLDIRLHITDDASRNMIAPLLMIPFVENCFKHGSSAMTGKQWIELNIQVSDNTLYFELSNSKPATQPILHNKNGIGLANVKKRLALLYPGKHQLDINVTETIFNVRMQIEMQKKIVLNELAPAKTHPPMVKR